MSVTIGREPDDWRRRLRSARERLGLSREELAAQAGVSPSSVRGYEAGRRRPRQESLEAIMHALRLDRTESNPIREGAGFRPVPSLFNERSDYYFSVEELQLAVERVPWPQFVVNDTMEVVAANRTAGAVWGLDFHRERARRSRVEMNLLAVASELDFPRVVENWDEVLELLCSIYKGTPAGGTEMTASDPYLAHVVEHFTAANHEFLARLLAAWARAVPSPAKVRQMYRIIWRHAAGRMSFAGLMTTANEREGLAFNDWIPANAETWSALNRLTLEMGEDPVAAEARLLEPRRTLSWPPAPPAR